ncbi:hypothetical protein LCGC14_1307640 [marine sediment metagenome]|uniref:Uncharacterized protein n=2 Tax=marine sediment metagenome TaxID=412755 RepID=A0A0F9KNA7_9ZZZZ
MCYICEARGTVGVGYRAAQKMINLALRALPGRMPRRPDWQNAPTKRLWSNADLKEYGEAWKREHSNS